MRIDQLLSQYTDLSRSQARRVLRRERVLINGERVLDAAQRVPPGATVTLNGEAVAAAVAQYWMLNKPAGVVSATRDRQWPTVMGLLPEAAQGTHIAGRLDRDTTGLLLLSDDGAWTHALTSPRRECAKRYELHTDKDIPVGAIERFAEGVWLHGERRITKPAQLEIVEARRAYLTLTEGRYHQVKRMLHTEGCEVRRLHRWQVGTIVLEEALKTGQARRLSETEILSFGN